MSFKPIRSESCTSVVSFSDPAIDWDRVADREIEESEEIRALEVEHSEKRTLAFARYIERVGPDTVRNPSKIKGTLIFRDGEHPTEFVIGVIPPDDFGRIIDETEHGTEDRYWRTFTASLRNVTRWPSDVPKKTLDGVEYADPAWIRQTFIRGLRRIAIEVGKVSWMWNQVMEDEAKN